MHVKNSCTIHFHLIKHMLLFNHSDIFSLPMPALWTVIVGDWDRSVDEQSEQRIQLENIFVHESFNNYNNDIGMIFAAFAFIICLHKE